jgi:ABC-type enterochelin transport system ATPase subunit
MSIASAFLPGENIHFSPILSKQLDIKRFQLGKELPVFFQVQVPARVGFCVRDMTTFGRLPDYKGKVGGILVL